MLGETISKGQFVYEAFFFVSVFERATMAFTTSETHSVMSVHVGNLIRRPEGISLTLGQETRSKNVAAN